MRETGLIGATQELAERCGHAYDTGQAYTLTARDHSIITAVALLVTGIADTFPTELATVVVKVGKLLDAAIAEREKAHG